MVQSQQLTIPKLIKKAKKAIKQSDFAAAKQLYNTVLQHQPNHPVAKKGLRKLSEKLPHGQSVQAQVANPSQGQINALTNLYYSGQIAKTEQACKELLQIFPQSLIVLNVLGAALEGQGKLQEAVQVFDKAIQLKPDYAEAHSNRGVILSKLGQFEEAVLSYDIAIQLKSDYAEAYNNRGAALKELGHPEEAVIDYDKAIQLKPDYAEAHNNRGVVLSKLGYQEEALLSYDKAIQLKPDYAESHSNRGIALRGLGHPKEAVISHDKSIQFKPDSAEAHNNRGIALGDLGQLEEAVISYVKAIQLRPDYAEAYNNRGIALKDLGHPEEAVIGYDEAIQLKPDYAEAYSNRGVALSDLGQFKEAVLSCTKAIQFKPDYAEAHNNLASSLRELGKLKDALLTCDKAIQLKPEYAEAHNNRGVVLMDLGQVEGALRSYDKAIQLKPDYPEAYSHRGYAFKGLGQLDKAMENFRKALSITPDYTEMHIILAIYLWVQNEWDLCSSHLKAVQTDILEQQYGEKDRFVQPYYNLLSKLLRYKDRHPQYYSLKGKSKKIYTIGDSHCLSSAHMNTRFNGEINCVEANIVIGCKAWHLANTVRNKYKQEVESIVNFLPNGSNVIIMFGEIDCRHDEGILKHLKKSKNNLYDSIAELVKNYRIYFSKLFEAKDISPIFYGVPAPYIKNRNLLSDDRRDLKEIIKKFNLHLAHECHKKKFLFMDPYTITKNDHGESNKRYHIDSHHLMPAAFQEMIDLLSKPV